MTNNFFSPELLENLVNTILSERLLLIAGNGGSCATADHLTGELLGRFKINRKPFPAVNICSSISTVSCISNDFGFEKVFSRQLYAFRSFTPIVIAFTTSGLSPNIVSLLMEARKLGITSFLFTGPSQNLCSEISNHTFFCLGSTTDEIQLEHIRAIHHICKEIDTLSDPL